MQSTLLVKRFINFPVSSNCFIITSEKTKECVLVDPACGNGEILHEYISSNRIKPIYIILTHEHFDHISSVEYLRQLHGCKVIASDVCSEGIGNPKKNLSLFYDQKGFSCDPADLIINKNNFLLFWNDFELRFFLTPGHSEGGICFSIENNLFTGDTIMKEYKPVVKLPGGDKKKLEISISRLINEHGDHTIVYPGHGEVFMLSDYTKLIAE